jgi:EmrB/QacA subfamily drug resistance transporter
MSTPSPGSEPGNQQKPVQELSPARTEASPEGPERQSVQRLGLILGLLVSAQFAVVLDYSIVQLALPTVRHDLAMSLADSQWIISAYGLTFAGFLLLGGRLSDIYGRKRLFLAGLLIFSLSSLAAGLASTEAVLISARVVQGVGAALASAAGLALIARIFGPTGKLNQALGIFTAVSSAGFTAGLLFGGVLTETLGWRWIFFVNVPIGIFATVLASRTLPDFKAERATTRSIDIPGAVSVTAGLMLLVYGLSEVGNGSTSLLTYASFAAAAVVLASFVAIERRAASPIMPLRFLGRRTIFLANATALLTFATTVPWIFFMATYFQVLLAYSPISAALAMVPGALIYFAIGGFGAPKLVARLGAKPVLVGAMLALAAGLLLTSRLSADSGYVTEILPAMLVASVGGALSATASNIAALAGTQRGEEGVASGLINTSRQVGGPVGLGLTVGAVGVLTHGAGLIGNQAEVVSALQDGFIVAACFAALAVVTSLLLKGKPEGKARTTVVREAPSS